MSDDSADLNFDGGSSHFFINESNDDIESSVLCGKPKISVLSLAEIVTKRKSIIDEVLSIFDVDDISTIVKCCRKCKWDISRILEEFNESPIISINNSMDASTECQICYDDIIDTINIPNLACNHKFCINCWKESSNNILWEPLYIKDWPHNDYLSVKKRSRTAWKLVYFERHKIYLRTLNLIRDKIQRSDYSAIDKSLKELIHGYGAFDLMRIAKNGNLCEKYWSKRILECHDIDTVLVKWGSIYNQFECPSRLEDGVIFLSEWIYPFVKVKDDIDDIENMCRGSIWESFDNEIVDDALELRFQYKLVDYLRYELGFQYCSLENCNHIDTLGGLLHSRKGSTYIASILFIILARRLTNSDWGSWHSYGNSDNDRKSIVLYIMKGGSYIWINFRYTEYYVVFHEKGCSDNNNLSNIFSTEQVWNYLLNHDLNYYSPEFWSNVDHRIIYFKLESYLCSSDVECVSFKIKFYQYLSKYSNYYDYCIKSLRDLLVYCSQRRYSEELIDQLRYVPMLINTILDEKEYENFQKHDIQYYSFMNPSFNIGDVVSFAGIHSIWTSTSFAMAIVGYDWEFVTMNSASILQYRVIRIDKFSDECDVLNDMVSRFSSYDSKRRMYALYIGHSCWVDEKEIIKIDYSHGNRFNLFIGKYFKELSNGKLISY